MQKILSTLFFGGSCFLCRGAAREVLCADCDAELPRLTRSLCPRCALDSPGGELCGRCLAHPPHYDATIAALAYEFPADALIHALKFRGELALAPLLARLLAERISESVDCVVAVPLSGQRLRERGYNQAVEIARQLSAKKPDLALCVREGDVRPQMELPWADRQKNIRGAFRCTRELIGGTVALIDDVMTTGATLDELARTLKRAGAARVVNWVIARTFPPND